VRWADGHVELFATGRDKHLQHATMQNGVWAAFEDVDATREIDGTPSAIMNRGDVPGPEVFARALDGTLVHLAWDGSQYGSFTPLLDQTTAADPMGWVRRDGSIDVFAVDLGGTLRHVRRVGTSWGAWSTLGNGVSACQQRLDNPPSANGGAGGSGGDATSEGAVATDDAGGCACWAMGPSHFGSGRFTWPMAAAAALVARRMRRKAGVIRTARSPELEAPGSPNSDCRKRARWPGS
jgi:hypothetical protein